MKHIMNIITSRNVSVCFICEKIQNRGQGRLCTLYEQHLQFPASVAHHILQFLESLASRTLLLVSSILSLSSLFSQAVRGMYSYRPCSSLRSLLASNNRCPFINPARLLHFLKPPAILFHFLQWRGLYPITALKVV